MSGEMYWESVCLAQEHNNMTLTLAWTQSGTLDHS